MHQNTLLLIESQTVRQPDIQYFLHLQVLTKSKMLNIVLVMRPQCIANVKNNCTPLQAVDVVPLLFHKSKLAELKLFFAYCTFTKIWIN